MKRAIKYADYIMNNPDELHEEDIDETEDEYPFDNEYDDEEFDEDDWQEDAWDEHTNNSLRIDHFT